MIWRFLRNASTALTLKYLNIKKLHLFMYYFFSYIGISIDVVGGIFAACSCGLIGYLGVVFLLFELRELLVKDVLVSFVFCMLFERKTRTFSTSFPRELCGGRVKINVFLLSRCQSSSKQPF